MSRFSGERARVGVTAVVTVMFVAMLAGTSRARTEEEKKAEPEPKTTELAVPSTEGWKEVAIPGAGVVVEIPPEASIDLATASRDAGRYFRVMMASGVDAPFGQDSVPPVNFAELKRWYENDAIGFERIVYEAADALVVARTDEGGYWETTACSAPIDGKPMCAQSIGALVADGKVTKLTHEECFAVVAIARSIREAK